MATCMALGEAAGVAAAISVKENTSPRNIEVKKIKEILKANKAVI